MWSGSKATFSTDFGSHRMAAILPFGVKVRSWHKNNVRIGILVVKLLLKEVSHKFLGGMVQKLHFPPISAAILTFGVKMRSWHKNNVRIGILVFKLLLKVVSHKFLADLVQKLDFPRFRRRPFWKNVNTCIWKCSRDVTWHPPESWRAIPAKPGSPQIRGLGPGLGLIDWLIDLCINQLIVPTSNLPSTVNLNQTASRGSLVFQVEADDSDQVGSST